MDYATIQRLNAVNREFYRVTAAEFDETRAQPWPGWQRLLPHLRMPLSGLDVGCGNGRFGVFLAEKILASPTNPVGTQPAASLRYHGVDSNAALLELARQSLTGLPGITVKLEERDIVENPPDSGEYDLVALFGVLHHVPGFDRRQALMRGLGSRVAGGGLLAFACWRFYEYERFRERIVPWPDDLTARVEPHDYLLDWRRGERALRYCHFVDDSEHGQLIAASGLAEVESYRADGFTATVNRYSILRKSA